MLVHRGRYRPHVQAVAIVRCASCEHRSLDRSRRRRFRAALLSSHGRPTSRMDRDPLPGDREQAEQRGDHDNDRGPPRRCQVNQQRERRRRAAPRGSLARSAVPGQ